VDFNETRRVLMKNHCNNFVSEAEMQVLSIQLKPSADSSRVLSGSPAPESHMSCNQL
jgi:hypothetical protein